MQIRLKKEKFNAIKWDGKNQTFSQILEITSQSKQFPNIQKINLKSRGIGETKNYQWYSFQYWILPLSGWGSDFICLNKNPKFLKITKEINIK